MSSPSGRSEGNGTNRYDKRVSTNTKVFRELTTKLSSNVQEVYIEAANKLAKWLGSEKAYYKEARPQIVTMLEAASYTLARLLGLRLASDLHISRCTPELQPRTAAYTALVQTVKPYLPIFLEDHLKTRLVNIFSTIYISPQGSQPALGTSAVPSRDLSAAAGGSANAYPSGVSSATTTPVVPISRGSVITSLMPPESSISQNRDVDKRGDKSATGHGSIRASQTSISRESFTASNSNSPAGSLPDSPATSQSMATRSSRSPAPPSGWIPINKPFLLRKAIFAGSAADSEDAQATIASAGAQPSRSADPPAASKPLLPPHPHPESTHMVNSHTTSSLSQSIDQTTAQKSVSPPVEVSGTSPTTSSSSSKQPTVKRQSFSSAKFELLAALDKKSWKKTSQPGAASQEQGKGKKKDDNSGAPQMTTMRHQSPITAMGSSEDILQSEQVSVAGSKIVEQIAVQTPEPTQQMVPHVGEDTHSEPVGNDTGGDVPSSELPNEKVLSLPPLSRTPDHEAPTPDKDPTGQQKAAPSHIEHSDAEEMDISSTDGIGHQHNILLPQTPSEMGVLLEPVTPTQTGQGASRQAEEAESANLKVQEVEQFPNPGVEVQVPASVSTPPPAAGTPEVNNQKVSHVNETTQHQPGSNDESVSHDEGTKGLAITTAPSETMSSPNRAAAVDVGPTRLPLLQQASQIDQTSVTQNDDTSAMVGAASSTFTNGVDAIMSDNERKTMAVVAQHILKEYGNADSQDRVDGMIKHLSSRLDDVFTSRPDGAKLHAVLEARKQSLIGGQAMSEKPEESSKTWTDSISHERKRPRSSSSDNTFSGPPSNRPRKEASTGIREESPTQFRGASQELPAELLNDRQEDVDDISASGDLLPSATKEPVCTAGKNEVAGKKASGGTVSNLAGRARGLAESLSNNQSLPQAGSSTIHPSQAVVPSLAPGKQHSYHPSQPYEIISVVEGSPMAVTRDIRFELDDEQVTLVKRWANRYDSFDQTSPCMSFTLICTRLPDIRASGGGEKDMEETIQNMAIQWPSGGGFWITVEADDRPPVSIPLSPPHWIERYEPLDLSSVVGKGITRIRFTQTRDHSQYLFILRAHRPTEAQLHELDSMSLTGHMWTETLARVAAPLPADLKSGILSLPGSDYASIFPP